MQGKTPFEYKENDDNYTTVIIYESFVA